MGNRIPGALTSDRRKRGGSADRKRPSRSIRADQVKYLTWLAWELNRRGLGTVINLPAKHEFTLLLPRTSDPVKIMANNINEVWFFTWGRGNGHRIRVKDPDVVERVWELTQ